MLIVGLTGGIGSGKSEVGRRLAARGAWLVDADVLARQAVAPGSKGLHAVVQAFGSEVLAEDGSLDRAAVAARVFSDPAARKTLEGIIHPQVAQGFFEALQEAEAGQAPLLVYDVPLLFENKLQDGFTELVVVDADLKTRQQRVAGRDGMAAEEFERRVQAQLPLEDKVSQATFVVDNRGDLEALEAEIDRLWAYLNKDQL